MVLPDYIHAFLADVLQPAVHEGLLSTGRKNSKTAGIGMFLLGLMVGPLRRPGLRIGCVSVNREKSGRTAGGSVGPLRRRLAWRACSSFGRQRRATYAGQRAARRNF